MLIIDIVDIVDIVEYGYCLVIVYLGSVIERIGLTVWTCSTTGKSSNRKNVFEPMPS